MSLITPEKVKISFFWKTRVRKKHLPLCYEGGVSKLGAYYNKIIPPHKHFFWAFDVLPFLFNSTKSHQLGRIRRMKI